MMKSILIACLICLGSISCAIAQNQTNAGTPTDRFVLHSKFTNDDHVIRVWVPRGYQAGNRNFPLLLMLDGEYCFEAVVPIADYLQRSKEVKEFVVAAVSYDVGFGPPLAVKRSRDFTPPVDANQVIKKTETNLHRLLKEELLPELRKKYRLDQNDQTLWSYSLSGSFALWLNYFNPATFDHYIIASPNASYGIMPKIMAGEVFNNPPDSNRKVMLSIDTSEIGGDQKILDDARKAIAQQNIKLFITTGESHTSSWFVSLPTSLRFVYGLGANQGVNQPAGTTTRAAP